jgi:hypothetical protein
VSIKHSLLVQVSFKYSLLVQLSINNSLLVQVSIKHSLLVQVRFKYSLLVHVSINRAQQNNRDPKRFSGCRLIKTRTFPCQKGVQSRTLTPDPRTFTKMSAILLQTPLVNCWHQRGAFGNPFSGRDFHPAHLGTSRHKLSMQSCSVRSSLRSCILSSGWELWGKNSHRNG